jgi:hypothetical protein
MPGAPGLAGFETWEDDMEVREDCDLLKIASASRRSLVYSD